MIKRILKNLVTSAVMCISVMLVALIIAAILEDRYNIQWANELILEAVSDLRIIALAIIMLACMISIVDASNLESDRMIEKKQNIKEKEDKAKKEDTKEKENKKQEVVKQAIIKEPPTKLSKAKDSQLEQQLEMVRQSRLGSKQ